MLKILDKIVYIVSLIAAFGLIGAYLSPIINPNTFVFFSLLGLAYPYLLIGNFILLLYWIFRWKRRTWQIVVVIAIGYPLSGLTTGQRKPKQGMLRTICRSCRTISVISMCMAGVIRKTRGKNYSII